MARKAPIRRTETEVELDSQPETTNQDEPEAIDSGLLLPSHRFNDAIEAGEIRVLLRTGDVVAPEFANAVQAAAFNNGANKLTPHGRKAKGALADGTILVVYDPVAIRFR